MLHFFVGLINDYTFAIYQLLSQRASPTILLMQLALLEHLINIEHAFALNLCMKGSSNHISSQQR